MEKIKLGLSLYPEQESVEEIEQYLKKAILKIKKVSNGWCF